MKKKTLFLSIILLGAISFLLISGEGFRTALMFEGKEAKRQFQSSSPQQFLLKHENEINEDIKLIQKTVFFSLGSAGQSNAAHMLNGILAWPKKSQSKSSLPENLLEVCKKIESTPLSQREEATSGVDFHWLERLLAFDHWAFDQATPYSPGRPVQRVDYIKPNFSELRCWAQLLMNSKFASTAPVMSLKINRKIARLLFTTDEPEAINLAIDVLNLESAFIERHSLDWKEPVDWKPIGQDTLKAAARLFNQQQSFLDPRLSNEDFIKYMAIPVGRCARLHSSLTRYLPFHLFLRSDLNEGFDRIRQFEKLKKMACRDSQLRRAWASNDLWILNPGDPLSIIKSELGPPLAFFLSPFHQWTAQDLVDNPSWGRAMGYLFQSHQDKKLFREAYKTHFR